MAAMPNPGAQDERVQVQASGDKDRRAVIVTGASRGIGAAIARLVGANGFPVAVNFVSDKGAADGVVREIQTDGGRAVAIRSDVSREEEILQLFETAVRELGTIGGLVIVRQDAV